MTQHIPVQHKLLNRLIQPTFRLGRAYSAFRLCGVAGLVLALGLALVLVAARDLQLWVMLAITGIALLVFFALAFLTKLITGVERLVAFHHVLAIGAATQVFLQFTGQPLLPYLDATATGLALFLACGRLGCLMAGCCHGRPAGWGVRYGAAHVAHGFARCYANIALFPVQALEAGWAACVALAGSLLIFGGAEPGVAFAMVVIGYAVGRFGCEFLRGDADKPFLAGFSEAQWTALLLTWGLAGAAMAGWLPAQQWQLGAAFVLTFGMLATGCWQRNNPAVRLLHPHHIHEVAEIIASESGRLAQIEVRHTSLGLQISRGIIKPFADSATSVQHYTLSDTQARLTVREGQILAGLIVRLIPAMVVGELIQGRQGVFHVLIRPGTGPTFTMEQIMNRQHPARRRPVGETAARHTPSPNTVPPSAGALPAGHDFAQISVGAPSPQAKLAVNTPGDAYEQEADRVAEQVTQGETSGQNPGIGHTAEELQTKASPHDALVASDLDAGVQALQGSGQPLDAATRSFMEPRFGHDFSQVRIHADTRANTAARSANALAFTVGNDIAFGAGQYQPESAAGQRLLAHELTHVVQQGAAAPTQLQRQPVDDTELMKPDEETEGER